MTMRRRAGRLQVTDGMLGLCTVSATSPLKVTVDGAASATTVNIDASGATHSVGDRLIWTMIGKQLAVLTPPVFL